MSDPMPPGTKPTPHLLLRPNLEIPRAIRVGWMGDTRPFDLHLGDGAVLRQAKPDQVYDHTYRDDGDYSIAVRIEGLPDPLVGVGHIRVRAEAVPTLRIEQPDPDNPYRVRFVEPNPAGSAVSHWDVHFGHNDESVLAVPLAAGQWVEHTYPAGQYQTRLREVETGRRNNDVPLTVADPVKDPDYTIAEDTADTTRMTVKVTLTRVTAKPVTVSFGDGDSQEIANPAVGTELLHTYLDPDLYIVGVGYADATGSTLKPVEVPFTAAAPAGKRR